MICWRKRIWYPSHSLFRNLVPKPIKWKNAIKSKSHHQRIDLMGLLRWFYTRRFATTNLAQHSVVTLLRHCFEWLQHCSNIATLCWAKNRRCESSCVTPLLAGLARLVPCILVKLFVVCIWGGLSLLPRSRLVQPGSRQAGPARLLI